MEARWYSQKAELYEKLKQPDTLWWQLLQEVFLKFKSKNGKVFRSIRWYITTTQSCWHVRVKGAKQISWLGKQYLVSWFSWKAKITSFQTVNQEKIETVWNIIYFWLSPSGIILFGLVNEYLENTNQNREPLTRKCLLMHIENTSDWKLSSDAILKLMRKATDYALISAWLNWCIHCRWWQVMLCDEASGSAEAKRSKSFVRKTPPCENLKLFASSYRGYLIAALYDQNDKGAINGSAKFSTVIFRVAFRLKHRIDI